MRIRMISCVACFIALLLNAENLLENPSFEEIFEKQPRHWSTLKIGSLERHHSVDFSKARTGQKSVRLVSRNVEGHKHYIIYKQDIPREKIKALAGDAEMEFSAYARTETPDVRLCLYIEAPETLENKYSFFTSSPQVIQPGAWRKIFFRFRLPADKPRYYVCLQLLSKGSVWYDDAYFGPVKQLKKDDNRVLNGDIELLQAENLPESWRSLQFKLQGKYHGVSSMAHSGEHSLQIKCLDPSLKVNHYMLWIQRGVEKQLKDCPPETNMKLSVWSNTCGNPEVKYRFYIEMMREGKYIGTFIKDHLSNYVGWQENTIMFKMPAVVPDAVCVCLQLLTPGVICFDDISLRKVGTLQKQQKKPLAALTAEEYGECRVVNFPSNNTWYLPHKPDQLNIRFILPPDAGGQVKVSLLDAKEKVLRVQKFSNEKKGSFSLTKLNKGAYIVRYEAGSYFDEEFFRIADGVEQHKRLAFKENGAAVFDRKAYFPIVAMNPLMEEEAFRIYQQAGFNMIVPAYLTNDMESGVMIGKIASKYGLYCSSWAGFIDRYSSMGKDNYVKFLEKQLQVARAIPNFVAFLDDESEMRQISPVNARNAYKEFFLRSSGLAFWQNHAPRMNGTSGMKYGNFDNIRRFTAASTVASVDIYPIPEGNSHSELEDKTMTCVGKYTELVRKSGDYRKPVWMVLQGCGWGEMSGGTLNPAQPRPNYRQLRFMVYHAVTYGAMGIVIYGSKGLGDLYSPFFAALADVMKELKYVGDFVAGGNQLNYKSATIPSGIRFNAWNNKKGEQIAVFVNESKQPMKVAVSWLHSGRDWYMLPSGKKWTSQELHLAADDVVIFSTEKKVIPKTQLFCQKTSEEDMQSRNWKASWCVHPQHYQSKNCTTLARHEFTLMSIPNQARLFVAADNMVKIKIGENSIGESRNYFFAKSFDITPYLRKGKNILEFSLWNEDGPSGLLYEGEIGDLKIYSGDKTVFSDDGGKNWIGALKKEVPPGGPWGRIQVLKEWK